MTSREETTLILALAAALDPRFTTHDTEQANARVVAWTDALDGVEGRFALDFVRAYYRRPVEWPVTPGLVRQAWLHEVTRRTARAPRELLAGVATQDRSPEAVAACQEARQVIAGHRATFGYDPKGGVRDA